MVICVIVDAMFSGLVCPFLVPPGVSFFVILCLSVPLGAFHVSFESAITLIDVWRPVHSRDRKCTSINHSFLSHSPPLLLSRQGTQLTQGWEANEDGNMNRKLLDQLILTGCVYDLRTISSRHNDLSPHHFPRNLMHWEWLELPFPLRTCQELTIINDLHTRDN